MMKRVVFKQTSNPHFENLTGSIGFLSEEYDRFVFECFKDRRIQGFKSSTIKSSFSYRTKEETDDGLISSSTIETIVGGLKKMRDGIISYTTKNSSYTFEVIE